MPEDSSSTPKANDELVANLRAEIVELKARIAHLVNRNAELTEQINNDRYERPPHY